MDHGGDVYRNKVNMDFSVNLNPLGAPRNVLEAVRSSVDLAGRYPDIMQTDVRRAIAEFEGVSPDFVFAGNGASELIMAMVRAVRPKKAFLYEPCFSGYEYALRAYGCDISYGVLSEDNGFGLTPGDVAGLTGDGHRAAPAETADDVDMIFLCDPGNPSGRNIDDAVLKQILDLAAKRNITVCLDDSFLLLSDKAGGVLKRRSDLALEYDNLIILTSLTKLFAMPGIRIGYAVSSPKNIEKLAAQLPEWNLPVTAEAAIVSGMRELSETDYLAKAMEIIQRERSYLSGELRALGMNVYESDTTFILFKGPEDLGINLLGQGILIRDCSTFKGLGRGYFRIAVKRHEENERLIAAVRRLCHGV